MKVCLLEGIIGAGKSTLLQVLETELKTHFNKIIVVHEPVEVWKATGALQAFYADVHNKAYEFQTFAFCTRLQALRDAYNKDPDADLYIIERSPYSDRYMFVKMLQEAGHFSKLQSTMYEQWWSTWMNLWPFKPTHVIHVNPGLEVCMERVQKRARAGEGSVSHDYQTELLKKHMEYFAGECKYPVLDLNNSGDIFDSNVKNKLVTQVANFLST